MTEQPRQVVPDRAEQEAQPRDAAGVEAGPAAGPEQLAGEPPAEMQREGGGELVANEEPSS
ncbi:MAG TPA: hypothetical protein VFM55_16240 [Micromonosporaceae bacterium]|nr:hypothetical protein [Micromonosporaceae bacterium]